MITQANSIHTMPVSGSGVAGRGSLSMHQSAKQIQPQSLRGSLLVTNVLHTTAMFWACEYEDCRSPGGASA